jgi:hypothetical protein
MYFDGSFTLNGVRGGMALISPKGDRLIFVTRLHFRATNNCHIPVLKEANQSFHTCAQDVQITCTTNCQVNSSQCYDYSITEYISYEITLRSEEYYRASSITAVILNMA